MILLVVREIQIITRITEIKKNNLPNSGEDVEELELSYFAGENVKWFSYFVELFDIFS